MDALYDLNFLLDTKGDIESLQLGVRCRNSGSGWTMFRRWVISIFIMLLLGNRFDFTETLSVPWLKRSNFQLKKSVLSCSSSFTTLSRHPSHLLIDFVNMVLHVQKIEWETYKVLSLLQYSSRWTVCPSFKSGFRIKTKCWKSRSLELKGLTIHLCHDLCTCMYSSLCFIIGSQLYNHQES